VYRIAVIQLYPKVRKALFLLVISSAFFIRVHVIADPKYCLLNLKSRASLHYLNPSAMSSPAMLLRGDSYLTVYVQ
jgi:hypothetical protein